MPPRRDSSLRQRRYAFADHGNSVQGQRQGKFLIKNNMAQHWAPCWGDGITVIRPFPMRNIEDPAGVSWDPYRFSAEHNDFGDWLRRYDAIRNFGDPGVTMIIRDPADSTIEDPQRLPAWVLYNAIDRAVAAGQEQQGWAALLRGGQNRGATLSRPSEVYLLQGAIMQHKSEIYNPPRGFSADEKPVVLELSSNAGVSLISELNKPRENSQAQDGDWEHMYENGDPVSLDYGRFITFYRLADGDPRTRQTVQAGGWNAATSQQPGGRRQEPMGYGCYLEPTFNNISANLRDFEQAVASKVLPWDEILYFPTIEEQANLIADKFPPDAILYAWRDHPEWIPETIRNRAVAAHSVNAPQTAGGWHGGWNQQGVQSPGMVAGGFAQPPAGGFSQPPTGGVQPQPYAPQQFPQQGQPQFPQPGSHPQVAAPLGQPQQAPPSQGFPQQGFPQQAQPQQGFPQQAQPQQGFGAPPTGFGTPQGQPQPPQQFANGPTGGPPPSLPPGGYPTAGFQGQPQQPAQPAQMAWAGQGNPAAQQSPMGQTPGGFAPQTQPPVQYQQPPQSHFPTQGQQVPPQQGFPQQGFPQQGFPQQAPPQQAPPQQAQPQQGPPQQGAPMSRAAMALQAAQQSGHPPG